MSPNVFRSSSEDETIELGRKVARGLTRPAVVILTGDLGAGKTTLTKGLVEALGGNVDDVSSPTFTLIHEYGNGVYHADLYRLETIREVERLGLDEFERSDSVLIVEWGDKFPTLWTGRRVEIRISDVGGDSREFEITGLLNG